MIRKTRGQTGMIRKIRGQTAIGKIRGQTAIFRRMREKRCLAPLVREKRCLAPLLREKWCLAPSSLVAPARTVPTLPSSSSPRLQPEHEAGSRFFSHFRPAEADYLCADMKAVEARLKGGAEALQFAVAAEGRHS